jgi:HemY protein
MMRFFTFLIKIILIAATVIFIASSEGTIEITWQDYIIETSVPFILAAFAVVMILWTVIYRLWRGIVTLPEVMQKRKKIKERERGFAALSAGMIALAAGDQNNAEKQSLVAQRYVADLPLTQLLTAQTALLRGDQAAAHEAFDKLAREKNGALLGLRGLVQEAHEKGDYQKALTLLAQVKGREAKSPYIISQRYDAEVREGKYKDALVTLQKMRKLKLKTADESRAHEVNLYLAQSEQAQRQGEMKAAYKDAMQAHKLDPFFVPAQNHFLAMMMKQDEKRQALKFILKYYKYNKSQAMIDFYLSLCKEQAMKPPFTTAHAEVDHLKPLYQTAKDDLLLNRALGRAAMTAKMFEMARVHLEMARDWKTLAELAVMQGDDEQAQKMLKLALEDQISPHKIWQCQNCGHQTIDYAVACHHCKTFASYH